MLIRVSRSDTFDLLQQNFVIPEDYAGLLAEVKERIRSASTMLCAPSTRSW